MKLVFNIVIAAAIVTGFLFPGVGMNPSYIPVMIGCMLFFNFLDVKIDPLKILRKELLITSALSFVFMPLVTYYGLSLGFEPSYRIGLLLSACAPSGIMGTILIRYLKHKDYELAFGNLLFSMFGSILFIPLILKLLIGGYITVAVQPLIAKIALLIILPFLVTRLANRFIADKPLRWIKKSAAIAIPALAFMAINSSIGSVSDEIQWDLNLWRLSLTVLVIYLLQGGLGYWIGNLLAGRVLRNTLTFVSSSRNLQLVLAIAVWNFSSLTVVPIIIAMVLHHSMNAFWLWLLQRE